MPALSGNTGNISGNGIVGTLNTWSCTISRAVADVTGFTNSGRNRLLGVYDLTGSAGGVLDSTAGFVSSNFLAAHTAASGSAITMTADSDVAANTIQATCVVSDVTMSVTKTGDSSVTFDFSLASTTTGTNSPFVISWS
jgi:hypothetical protein